MGALCGKETAPDPFSQPGRTLSSAPPQQTTSSVPPPAKRKVGGPPRTLGDSPSPSSQEDARKKAAEAAERRARESKKVTGPLGKEIQKQKAKPDSQVLADESRKKLQQREVDGQTDALRHE